MVQRDPLCNRHLFLTEYTSKQRSDFYCIRTIADKLPRNGGGSALDPALRYRIRVR